MLSRSLFLSSVMLSCLLLPSCNKDNDTRDIPGPAGTDGTPGKDGKNGKDGLNGVAAVVYDSFDSTQSCSQAGQLIFVNADLSFFVCRESKWDRLLVKGKDGDAGAAGKDGIITVETRLGDSCSENGQLLYDMSTKNYYSCQNKAWQQVVLNGAKGDKGEDGVAVVVFSDFNPNQPCSRSGQLVYSAEKKTFHLCQGSKWTDIDLKGPKGDTGAPGANGQTLFVETEDQLPTCKESNFGVLYILKKSGDVKVCSSANSAYSWITVYQAPANLLQGDQAMVQDCMQANEKAWPFYRLLIHTINSTTSGFWREAVCKDLAQKAANMESLHLASIVHHYATSSGDVVCGTGNSSCSIVAPLNDSNAYILKYFVNLKVLGADTVALTNLNSIPTLPSLKSLDFENLSNQVIALGNLKNLPALNSLTLMQGYLAATNGESGLINIVELSKTLNVVKLNSMSLTKRDLVELAKLPNLIELNLERNPLTDFSPFTNMQSLAKLKYTGQLSQCPFPETTRCN